MKQRQKCKMKTDKQDLYSTGKIQIPPDPVELARLAFKFTPTVYQERLLRDKSKRIVVRWSRQAGKTTTVALKALCFALSNPKTLTLIVAPSLRQSMIMGDRVEDFLDQLSLRLRRKLVAKEQRTVKRFKNGSRIIILPNSPQLLRGYTADLVIPDEANFFNDDELVFYSVLYPMLATTDGILIVPSTPWNKDSVFYRMCKSDEFSKHVVTCEDVVKVGLIKQSFIDQMRQELPEERFRREFYAEFIEDSDNWLTQSLIVNCIDSQLELCDFHSALKGNFFVGVDFGKHRDHSVIVVVDKSTKDLRLVHAHRFPLKTDYASVIGYIRSLRDRWHSVRSVYADITGVGDYIVEDMTKSGITNVIGVPFTICNKEEMATIAREKMRAGEVKIPYWPTKTSSDIDFTAELNVEKFELLKTGHIKFAHPEGSHDDVFWATCLALYAAVKQPVSLGMIGFGPVGDKA